MPALTGWILHIEVLTRLNTAFIPTQFNSAVCFPATALGWARSTGNGAGSGGRWRGVVLPDRLSQPIRACRPTSVSGIDTLAGYYLTGPQYPPSRPHGDGDRDRDLQPGRGADPVVPGDVWNERKAPASPLGQHRGGGGAGRLSFLCRAACKAPSGWVGFTQIGFPSAALCLLAGTNVLLNVGSRFNAGAVWLPIPLCTGLLALLFTLTQALSADQDAAFSQRVQTAAWDLEGEAETQMHDMFTAIDRMANRWNLGGRTDARVWDGDAAAYFRAYPGLNAMVWGDAKGTIGRLSSLTAAAVGDRKLGDAMALSPRGQEAAKDALSTGKAQISRAVTLRDGQLGFLYISPVTNRGAPDGILLAAVSLKRFFGNVLSHSTDPSYLVTVQEDGQTIFSNAAITSPKEADARWMRQADFVTGKIRWVISLTPTRRLSWRDAPIFPLSSSWWGSFSSA